MKNRQIKIGACGTAATLLCGFTPILVLALPAIGVGALGAYPDWVLFPALAVFVALLGHGLYRMKFDGKVVLDAGN